jgi:N-acetylneuraminate synthase
MTTSFQIGGRQIGPDQPTYIVAELSANHNGSFDRAVKVIEAAHQVGADAIKLQTYTPDTITLKSDSDLFAINGESLWKGRSLYDLYAEAYMPWEWQPRLKEIANRLGLALFSSPFDNSAVDFLEKLDMPAYKIASFELIDLPLIKRAAATGKPVIISTGMGSLDEIEEAVTAVRSVSDAGLALLKCTSAYPASPDELNLRTIPDLMDKFKVPVGLSDHTQGVTASIVAVSIGACIIEKHLTLSRADGGPDAAFSLEPHEFGELVRATRTAECALGDASYEPSEQERTSRALRRSLFITRDVPANGILSPDNVRSIRPAAGLAPKYYEGILGRRVKTSVKQGTPLTWDLLQ